MTRPSTLARAAVVSAAGAVTGVVLFTGLAFAAAKRIADGINEVAGEDDVHRPTGDFGGSLPLSPGDRIDGDGYVFTLPEPNARLESAIDLYFKDVR